MESKRLTDEEVLALDKIKVEGNEKIIALYLASGYYGRGGSNNSPYTKEIDASISLEELEGRQPMIVFGVRICAVVNDVVYLTWANRANNEVFTFDVNGCFDEEYGIAYDTMRGCLIKPVLKKE